MTTRNSRMPALAMVVLLCCPAAAVLGAETTPVEFLRGHIDLPFVRVEPPVEVDWARAAPALEDLDLEEMTWKVNLYGRYARVAFDLDAPAWIDDYHYYLLSSDGVTELSPGPLRGILWLNREHTAIAPPNDVPRPHATGYLETQPRTPLPMATGGIVVVSREPQRIVTASSDVPLRDVLDAGRDCGHTTEQHADATLEHVSIAARYRVTIAAHEYLFVAWSPHHTCSSTEPSYYFKLVAATDPARVVATSTAVWPPVDE